MWRPQARALHRTVVTVGISLLVAILALAACASASGAHSTSGTTRATAAPPTATGSATATLSAPPGNLLGSRSIAWIQSPSGGKPEVWASIDGAAPRKIVQAAGDICSTAVLGPPVLSPDGQHIVVVGGAGCGDGQEHGAISLVTVASGTFTPLPNSNDLTNSRSVGWLNNATIWYGGGNATYTLGRGSVSLPSVSGGIDAVVRGTTLFYVAASGTPSGPLSATLHRYSLTLHHDLNTIDLGSFQLPTDRSPGDFHFQGWDASPDGTHVIYQVTTAGPVTSGLVGIASSRVYYANADGSGARQILEYMTTTNVVRMRFSPDGTQVAATEAEPAPDIVTGCVTSSGLRSDPCFHAYTLPAGKLSANYPAWAADGRSFIVDGGDLYRFRVGVATGTLVQPGGFNPWVV